MTGQRFWRWPPPPFKADRLQRLATAYEKSTRGSLAKLAIAIEQGNLEQSREIGHKLKSGSNWFGALALGLLGEQLETLPNDVQMDSLRTLRIAAEASFSAVLGEIAETLAALNKSQGDCHAPE